MAIGQNFAFNAFDGSQAYKKKGRERIPALPLHAIDATVAVSGQAQGSAYTFNTPESLGMLFQGSPNHSP
jgi:hypothetical protein